MKRSMRAISMIVMLFLGTGSATVLNAATPDPISIVEQDQDIVSVEQEIIRAATQAALAAERRAKAEVTDAGKVAKAAALAARQATTAAEKAVKESELEPWSAEKIEKARQAVKAALEAEKVVDKATEAVAEAVRKAESIVRISFVTKARIEATTGVPVRTYTVGAVQTALSNATVWETLGFTENAVDLAMRIRLAPNETRAILRRMSLNQDLNFEVTIVDKMHIKLDTRK